MEFDFLLDGELIGETIYLFDALELAGNDLRGLPYGIRMGKLQKELSAFTAAGSPIQLVDTVFESKAKHKRFESLKKQGVEGVVFKLLSAPYKPGRPASGGDQLKFKFTNTCTCQVSGHNEKGKRSVYIQMLDGKELVDMGKVTILPNFDIPEVGTLVEVKYLYRHVHGALYQPIYLGPRDDIDKADQVSIVKVKEGIEDEEEN